MSRKASHLTVTDCFCGAGGSSQGIKEATESLGLNYGTDVKVEYALNHWDLAIETHNTNFPNTKHDCTDISACDPRRYPSTDILIGSPECTNHSVAKGQERVKAQLKLYETGALDPAQERSRQTMWDIPRFAEYHNYRAIIVENVVDARTWVQYPAWIMAMQLLGYKHKEVYLNSMFCWPTPQSRDRMYVVFWKKGMKAPDLEIRPKAFCHKCGKDIEARQRWKPGRNFGKYKRQYDYACADCNTEVTPYYYAAFNVIDWSDLGTRIGARDKPLSENTLRRIQYGIDKYCTEPFTIDDKQTTGIDFREFSAQTTHQNKDIVFPFIVKNYGGAFNPKHAPSSIASELGTITTSDHHALCSFITESHRTGKARSITDELNAITAGGIKSGLVTTTALQSFITYYYKTNNASHISEPVHTLTANDRAAVVTGKVKIEDCYYRMLKYEEIKRGMAFPDSYKILGNAKEQTKQCGNAVTPPAEKLLAERVFQIF